MKKTTIYVDPAAMEPMFPKSTSKIQDLAF